MNLAICWQQPTSRFIRKLPVNKQLPTKDVELKWLRVCRNDGSLVTQLNFEKEAKQNANRIFQKPKGI